jgi:hypothetical protein
LGGKMCIGKRMVAGHFLNGFALETTIPQITTQNSNSLFF